MALGGARYFYILGSLNCALGLWDHVGAKMIGVKLIFEVVLPCSVWHTVDLLYSKVV